MSYEGFDEFLCPEGHHWSVDVYALDEETNECPWCSKKPVWRHSVDQTNGVEFDDDGEPYPNTVVWPLEVVGFDEEKCEDHYGNKYYVKRTKYKIPE